MTEMAAPWRAHHPIRSASDGGSFMVRNFCFSRTRQTRILLLRTPGRAGSAAVTHARPDHLRPSPCKSLIFLLTGPTRKTCRHRPDPRDAVSLSRPPGWGTERGARRRLRIDALHQALRALIGPIHAPRLAPDHGSNQSLPARILSSIYYNILLLPMRNYIVTKLSFLVMT